MRESQEIELWGAQKVGSVKGSEDDFASISLWRNRLKFASKAQVVQRIPVSFYKIPNLISLTKSTIPIILESILSFGCNWPSSETKPQLGWKKCAYDHFTSFK